jgi:hypothetical protein
VELVSVALIVIALMAQAGLAARPYIGDSARSARALWWPGVVLVGAAVLAPVGLAVLNPNDLAKVHTHDGARVPRWRWRGQPVGIR